MIWIIIGLLSFVLQIYILKNTWTDSDTGLTEFRWEHAEKLSIPLYAAILMFLLCMIPILSIAEFIMFWIVWFKKYMDACGYISWRYYTYWRFKDKFLSRKI